MKKAAAFILAGLVLISLAACSSSKEKTVFDLIKESSVAKMELPDGSSIYVDGEIASLRSFADLELMEAPLEPADNEDDWLYRIVFNPSEKVKNADEITVSFHQDYVQIGSEFYLPRDGVEFRSVLAWAESKFDSFFE